MILTAHQPTFLPWTGLFHKIAQAEEFVFFDDVQFEYHEFGNRNWIMTANGPLLITIPVEKQGHMSRTWVDMRIAGRHWVDKTVKTLAMAYVKTPYGPTYLPKLEALLRAEHEFIVDLNVSLTCWLMEELGLRRTLRRSSTLGLEGYKSDRVLDMCRKLGAHSYWYGPGGRDYAKVEDFKAAGIDVHFQKFSPPIYARSNKRLPFRPGLSVVDLLMMHGPDSLTLILEQASFDAPR